MCRCMNWLANIEHGNKTCKNIKRRLRRVEELSLFTNGRDKEVWWRWGRMSNRMEISLRLRPLCKKNWPTERQKNRGNLTLENNKNWRWTLNYVAGDRVEVPFSPLVDFLFTWILYEHFIDDAITIDSANWDIWL